MSADRSFPDVSERGPLGPPLAISGLEPLRNAVGSNRNYVTLTIWLIVTMGSIEFGLTNVCSHGSPFNAPGIMASIAALSASLSIAIETRMAIGVAEMPSRSKMPRLSVICHSCRNRKEMLRNTALLIKTADDIW
jgi:hypothetical protein